MNVTKWLPRNRAFLPNFDGMHNHNNERHKNVFGKYIFTILTALSQQEVAGDVKHNIYSSFANRSPLEGPASENDPYTCMYVCILLVHASAHTQTHTQTHTQRHTHTHTHTHTHAHTHTQTHRNASEFLYKKQFAKRKFSSGWKLHLIYITQTKVKEILSNTNQ